MNHVRTLKIAGLILAGIGIQSDAYTIIDRLEAMGHKGATLGNAGRDVAVIVPLKSRWDKGQIVRSINSLLGYKVKTKWLSGGNLAIY